jgi:proliferating cell nuclear antigen
MRLFELKTLQSTIFKTLVESLKENVVDVNFHIDATSIRVVKTDVSSTILINMELDVKKFEFYTFNNPVPLIIGVNTFNLFKIMKTVNSDDILSLYVDDSDCGVLQIQIDNNTKKTFTKYKLNLMEIDEETYDIPENDFDTIVNFNSQTFQKIVKNMSSLSKNIDIKTYNKQIIFSCEGDFASRETIINENDIDTTFEKHDSSIIQGCYSSKHLQSLIKCTNLCENIKICMKNDWPLYIEYSVGDIGKISFLIVQKTDETNYNSD